jgi:zinc protease
VPKRGGRIIYMVDKPGAPQSQIWIGEVGVASTAPDIFPVRVMNNILGGSFDSRLNGNLRSEHAYSYGAFSFYDTHREAGPFAAAGGVVSDKTAEALGEFIKELERMKTGEVSAAELSDAKDALEQAIPALFASDERTAGAYARAWLHGLPADYYATYQQRVEAVTKDEVAKAARDRLHPNEMAVVVVGPEAAIAPRIEALKLGRIEVRDANGEARKAAAAAAGK